MVNADHAAWVSGLFFLANDKKEETTHPGSMFGVDHVSNYLDHIEDQTDHSQNYPGHQQARFFLPRSMDKKRSNDNVANADDKEDRHHCGCKCKNRGRSVPSSKARKSISLLLGQTAKTAVINVEVKIAKSPASSRSSHSSPSQAKSGSQTAAKSSEQGGLLFSVHSNRGTCPQLALEVPSFKSLVEVN